MGPKAILQYMPNIDCFFYRSSLFHTKKNTFILIHNRRNMMKKLIVLSIVAILVIGCTTQKKQDNSLIYPVSSKDTKDTQDSQMVVQSEEPAVEQPIEEFEPVTEDAEIVLEEDNSTELAQLEERLGSLENSVKTRDEQLTKSAEEQEKLRKENEELRKQLAEVQKEEKKATLKNVSLSTNGDKQNYLRIIALPEHEYYKKMAADIVSHLEKEGIAKAAPRKSGKFWVIDISDCPTPYSAEGKDFQKRIRD